MKTYFSPLIFPEIMKSIPYIREFRDFHNFYDMKYMKSKGEIIIYIELGIMIYLVSLLILSFYKVTTTHPGQVPENNLWKIQIPHDANKNIQTEIFAIAINNREKELLNNKNKIFEKLENTDNLQVSQKEYFVNERIPNDSVRYCLVCKSFKVSYI